MLPAETDVVVLGAGPGGCATAIRACRAGVRVLVLEAAGVDRDAPGETLHPGIEPLFAELGLAEPVRRAGFHRHAGVWTESGGERSFEAYGADAAGPWQGFQADRRVLRRLLWRAAVAAGAQVVPHVRADSVLRDGARVCGVSVGPASIRARWVVDATGRSAWLARRLDLARRIASPPLEVRFGWRAGAPDALSGQPLFALEEDGWAWEAPLGDNRTAWARCRVGKASPRAMAQVGRGSDYSWRLHSGCAGAGWFLVGDAASLLDPASSHGVLRAVMSGMLVGHLIEAEATGRTDEAALTSAYRNWQEEHFDHDTVRLRALLGNALA